MPTQTIPQIPLLWRPAFSAPADAEIESGSGSQSTGNGSARISLSDILPPYINVQWYGALGDNANDDSSAVQAAFDNPAVNVIIFPPGIYLVEGLVVTTAKTLIGVPGQTTLKGRNGAQYILAVNPGTQGTTDPTANVTPFIMQGIELRGRSDLGFSEFVHNLILSAVSDVLIENCRITASRGDGIYLGCFVDATERHNERVTIRKTVFDGVNKQNRNAITVTDCTKLNIEDCFFTRYVDASMPAAIDIEPNVDAWTRLRDITIQNNRFYDIGGTYAVNMAVTKTQPLLTTKISNIAVRNNSFDLVPAAINIFQTWDAAATPVGVWIEGNSVNVHTGITISTNGIRGVRVLNNTMVVGSLIYFAGNNADVLLEGNVGQSVEVAFDNITNAKMQYNTFNNAGNSTWAFRSGAAKTITNLEICHNTVGGAGWAYLYKQGAGSSFAGKNLCQFNAASFSLTNEFQETGILNAILAGSKSWDPGSLADGASTATTITTFSGLAPGDPVSVSFSALTNAPWHLFGHVLDASTVHVTLTNRTSGVVDLASGTLRATVFKHGA